MSKQYYLVSQLPDISASGEKSTLPITESYYRNLCSRFLEHSQLNILNSLTLEAPRECVKTGSDFLDKWYDNERSLRFALYQIRAQKMKKDLPQIPFTIPGDIVQAARTALGMDSPLSAEQFLFEYRISVLNNLQPLDTFSTDYVYAYGIRLMLLERMKKFDRVKGTESYHKIYETILDGDR